MNDAYSFQCCLMGDVLFKEDVTIKVGITVSGPTTYEWTQSIRQGTWFANALVFWQYIVAQWNTFVVGGTMSVSAELDPDAAGYGSITLSPDSGWGTLVSTYFEVPGAYLEVGLASATLDIGSAFVPTVVANPPGWLVPCWPPTTYERGVSNLTGSSERGHDGTVYSVSGQFQETRVLGLALDRRSQNFDEVNDFIGIWRDYWCRGRSVTYYLDREDIPTVSQDTIGSGDILVLTGHQDRIDFSRVIAYKEFQNKTSDITLGVRPSVVPGQSYMILEAL